MPTARTSRQAKKTQRQRLRTKPPRGNQPRRAVNGRLDSKHSDAVSFQQLQMRRESVPVSTGLTLRNVGGTGAADLLAHRFNYQPGYVYVGNDTLGAKGTVYFVESSKTLTVLPFVPILPADSVLGQTYIADIAKHYSRKRIRSVKVSVVPISAANATSVGVDIIIAPYRSGAILPSMTSGKNAANDPAATIGMSGAVQFPAWKGHTLDLTRYIAGGSGAAQNEFNVLSTAASTSSTVISNSLVSPCGFAIAGDSTGTTYDGVYIARVYVELVMDFLDFIGGFSAAYPNQADALASIEAAHAAKNLSDSSRGGGHPSGLTDQKACEHKRGSVVEMDYVRIEEPLSAPTPSELRQLALTRQSATPTCAVAVAGALSQERKRP